MRTMQLSFIKEILLKHEFIPYLFLKSSFLQTMLGVSTGAKLSLPFKRELVRVAGGKIAIDCVWHAKPKGRATIVLVHGLIGSSKAPYLTRFTQKAFKQGYNIVLVNLRGFGNSEHLSAKIYHAGQSGDIANVVNYFAKKGFADIFVCGFSLGGNIVLKYMGEKSKAAACVAISPLLDLSEAAASIDYPKNRLYRAAFVRGLKNLIRRKAKLFPELYKTEKLKGIKSIRDFDTVFQAPLHGFKNADDYYEKTSAAAYLGRIKKLTLIIHAADDSITPATALYQETVKKNPFIIRLIPKHGGHVGFIGKTKGEDRYWAENRALEFFSLVRTEQDRKRKAFKA